MMSKIPQCSFLHQDASPQTLLSLQQILSFELKTKIIVFFSITFITT
jgi:hypothetical protein